MHSKVTMLLLKYLKAVILGTAAVASMLITATRGDGMVSVNETVPPNEVSDSCRMKARSCVEKNKDLKLDQKNIKSSCEDYTNTMLACAGAACKPGNERELVRSEINEKFCIECENTGICTYSDLRKMWKETRGEGGDVEMTLLRSSNSSVVLSASGVVVLFAMLMMAWAVSM